MSSPAIHSAHPPLAASARASHDIIAKSIGTSQTVASRALCHPGIHPLPPSWASLPSCWPFYQDQLFLHFMSKLYLLNVLKLFLHCIILPLLLPGAPHFSPKFVPLVVIFPVCHSSLLKLRMKNLPVSESIPAFPPRPTCPTKLGKSTKSQSEILFLKCVFIMFPVPPHP